MKFDILVLSPHMDDAVLSLGQNIISWIRRGKKVKVITVFTKFGDGLILPDYSKNYINQSGFENVVDFEKERVKEDETAMKLMRVEWEHWGYVDAGFRGNYLSRAELLDGKIKKEDNRLVDDISMKIRKCDYEEIYLPFGVGGHVDHMIVKKVGESAKKTNNIRYYLESPYLWQNYNYLKYIKYFKNITWPREEKNKMLKSYTSQYKLLMQDFKWPLFEIVI